MKDDGIPTDALESGKRKALVVDDDPDAREIFSSALSAAGVFEMEDALMVPLSLAFRFGRPRVAKCSL